MGGAGRQGLCCLLASPVCVVTVSHAAASSDERRYEVILLSSNQLKQISVLSTQVGLQLASSTVI